MEWLKRFAEKLRGKTTKAIQQPDREVKTPRGEMPQTRMLADREIYHEKTSTRMRAEELTYTVPAYPQMRAEGECAPIETAMRGEVESLLTLCRRSASDIAAQENFR